MILSELKAAIDRIKELKGDDCQVEICGSCSDCDVAVTFDYIGQVDIRIYPPGDVETTRIYMLQSDQHSEG